MTQKSVIAAAAAETAAQFDAMVLDPRELVHAALERVAALNYPCAEHEAKAAARVRELPVYLNDLLVAWDTAGVRRVLNDFEHQCRLLSLPLPMRTFHDDLAAKMPAMNKVGWLSEECEFLVHFAAGGHAGQDEVTSFDASSARLKSGAVVTRKMIRDYMRPAWQLREHWEQTSEYQKLQAAEQTAIAAEARARAIRERPPVCSAGPAHLIGR
jgi:hypothetical protein